MHSQRILSKYVTSCSSEDAWSAVVGVTDTDGDVEVLAGVTALLPASAFLDAGVTGLTVVEGAASWDGAK